MILISPKNRTVYNFRGELIKEIISKGYEVIVTGPDHNGTDKILKLGARFVPVPLNKNGLNVLADLRYLFALWRLLRREKPDITLGYTIKPVVYGAIAAKLAGVGNICSMVTGAGYVFTAKSEKAKIVRFLAGLLYRIGFGCSDTVIFQNRDDMEEFTKNKLVKRDKCRIVHGSGVNLEKFAPAPLPQRLTFFMLSRILYSKGVGEYLKAAEMVKSKYPEVRFMLLGAVECLQDSMKAEELAPYLDSGIIDYYGETEDVTDYFRQCSVYVLPSYREGVPRTVLEALAMGRPVITTDAPGCRETVINGVNGFLVPVKDSIALARRMKWFVLHPEAVEKMGQAGLALCREKFDVRKVNRMMLEYLKVK